MEAALLSAAEHIFEDISENIIPFTAFKVVGMGSGTTKTMKTACIREAAKTATEMTICAKSAVCPVKSGSSCASTIKSCMAELVI